MSDNTPSWENWYTKLDHGSPIPLSSQLESLLRQGLSRGLWPENSAIPSENELSRASGLCRMTVRGVLQRLVQEGLIYRVQGKGTYVSPAKIIGQPLSRLGIRQQMENLGLDTETRLISAALESGGGLAGTKLRTNGPLFHILRLRLVKGEPLSLHSSYIPQSVCPTLLSAGFDFQAQELCRILEQLIPVDQSLSEETLEIAFAGPKEAELLRIKVRFPLLHVENLVHDRSRRPVEYSSVLFRGDRIKIQTSNQ